MNENDKIKLFSDIAVIKEKVDVIHGELKPEIKKNSKFRIMVTGFILIGLPIAGFIIRLTA